MEYYVLYTVHGVVNARSVLLHCIACIHLRRWIDGDELLAITSRDTPSVSPMTYRALHALVVMVMSAYVLHTLVVLPLGSESVTYCIT